MRAEPEETAMDHKTEAQLLQAMAGAKSQAEQEQYAAELAALRHDRTATRQAQAASMWAAEAVPPVPHRATASRASKDTDWLEAVASSSADPAKAEEEMRAQGSVWYSRLHEGVKKHPDEVLIQAVGQAQHLASQYGAASMRGEVAFLEQVRHHAEREGLPIPDPASIRPEPYEHGQHDDSTQTKSSDSPSLAEGTEPESDQAPTSGTNQSENLDAATWPEQSEEAWKNGDQPPGKEASRKTATRYCKDHSVYVGEGNQETHDHCDVETRKKAESSRRTAAEGQTCATCGDKIAKDPSSEDPSTWHHDNGEKHDHEAKPGKEASRKTAASFEKGDYAVVDGKSVRVKEVLSGNLLSVEDEFGGFFTVKADEATKPSYPAIDERTQPGHQASRKTAAIDLSSWSVDALYQYSLQLVDMAQGRAPLPGHMTTRSVWAEHERVKAEIDGRSRGKTSSTKTAGRYLYVEDGSTIDEGDDLGDLVRRMVDQGYTEGYVTNQDGGRQDMSGLIDKYASRKTASARAETLRTIVDRHQHQEIDGMIVDVQTANLLLQVFDALSAGNKEKFDSLPLDRLVDLGWRSVASRKQAGKIKCQRTGCDKDATYRGQGGPARDAGMPGADKDKEMYYCSEHRPVGGVRSEEGFDESTRKASLRTHASRIRVEDQDKPALRALATLDSVDDDFEGISGRRVVEHLLAVGSMSQTTRRALQAALTKEAYLWVYDLKAIVESGQPRVVDGISVDVSTAQRILDAMQREDLSGIPFNAVFDAAVGATFASRQRQASMLRTADCGYCGSLAHTFEEGHPGEAARLRDTGDNGGAQWEEENASNRRASRKTAGALSDLLAGVYPEDELDPEDIPSDYAVQPLTTDAEVAAAIDPAACGHCGLVWDDGKSTSMTPTPSGRCPFEYFHQYDD